jgi:hypothetical protein
LWISVPQRGPAVDLKKTREDVTKSKDYLDSQPPEKRTKFLNNIVDNIVIPDTRQDLVESKMFLDRLSPTARAEVLYTEINNLGESYTNPQSESNPPEIPPAGSGGGSSSISSDGSTKPSEQTNTEILTKYNPSERAKIIPAAQNLGFAITAIIPGSIVILEIAERTDLLAVLNKIESEKFLTLQDNPTQENLAAFLNIPPQKLGEFLNMLSPDELNEVFEKILPEGARENILSGLNPTERVEIEKKLQSFSAPPL